MHDVSLAIMIFMIMILTVFATKKMILIARSYEKRKPDKDKTCLEKVPSRRQREG